MLRIRAPEASAFFAGFNATTAFLLPYRSGRLPFGYIRFNATTAFLLR